jgi:hypothetical protein
METYSSFEKGTLADSNFGIEMLQFGSSYAIVQVGPHQNWCNIMSVVCWNTLNVMVRLLFGMYWCWWWADDTAWCWCRRKVLSAPSSKLLIGMSLEAYIWSTFLNFTEWLFVERCMSYHVPHQSQVNTQSSGLLPRTPSILENPLTFFTNTHHLSQCYHLSFSTKKDCIFPHITVVNIDVAPRLPVCHIIT